MVNIIYQLPVFLTTEPRPLLPPLWLAGSYSDQGFRWEVFKVPGLKFLQSGSLSRSQHVPPTETSHSEIFNKSTLQQEKEEFGEWKPPPRPLCFPVFPRSHLSRQPVHWAEGDSVTLYCVAAVNKSNNWHLGTGVWTCPAFCPLTYTESLSTSSFICWFNRFVCKGQKLPQQHHQSLLRNDWSSAQWLEPSLDAATYSGCFIPLCHKAARCSLGSDQRLRPLPLSGHDSLGLSHSRGRGFEIFPDRSPEINLPAWQDCPK